MYIYSALSLCACFTNTHTYIYNIQYYIYTQKMTQMSVCKRENCMDHTKLYSFRFNCRMVSFTAANTNRMFSVSVIHKLKIV